MFMNQIYRGDISIPIFIPIHFNFKSIRITTKSREEKNSRFKLSKWWMRDVFCPRLWRSAFYLQRKSLDYNLSSGDLPKFKSIEFKEQMRKKKKN